MHESSQKNTWLSGLAVLALDLLDIMYEGKTKTTLSNHDWVVFRSKCILSMF